jgi:hypothetical protein
MRLVLAPLLLLPAAILAQSCIAEPRAGDAYQITLTRDSEQGGTDGSSGSSHDQDTVIERVLAVRGDGLELEYDLPADTPKEERSSTWQFPARVFRPFNGPVQLLDRPAVQKRVDAWLKAAKLPQSACGHLIFTWNAFRIECDPDAVIKTVEAFEFPFVIYDGEPYRESNARGPAALAKESAGRSGGTFRAKMEIDPDAVRRSRAETDVGVGEIMKRPLTLDAALAKHANEAISGTVSVDLETDAAGQIWRKRTVTVVEIKDPNGRSETQTTTATLERHPLTS